MKSVFLLCGLIVLSSFITSCSLLSNKHFPFFKKTETALVEEAIDLDALEAQEKVKVTKAIPQIKVSKKVVKKEPKRAPASIKPQKTTGNIIYTPLWIKIPVSNCIEIVKNPNYKNGACIKRIP